MQPKYRSDVKGQVKENIADFEDSVLGELRSCGDFLLCVEDTETYREYQHWLTIKEMRAAFKRAYDRV